MASGHLLKDWVAAAALKWNDKINKNDLNYYKTHYKQYKWDYLKLTQKQVW